MSSSPPPDDSNRGFDDARGLVVHHGCRATSATGPGAGRPHRGGHSSSNPYSKYLAEILRTEGLNEFATVDVGTLSASSLAPYDVVVLGNVTVSAAQATDLTTWVNGGGNLIAMRPSGTLTGLLGIAPATGTTTDNYLKIDTTTTAGGAGIVSDTIQYHGAADNYTLSGAQAIATIYSNATTATTFPAVTLRSVGTNAGRPRRSPTTCPVLSRRPVREIPPGPDRNGTARPRSGPTTCSSAVRRPTGSTSARSPFRRPTSSSGCWPTWSR